MVLIDVVEVFKQLARELLGFFKEYSRKVGGIIEDG
jgi:hypothetical protein